MKPVASTSRSVLRQLPRWTLAPTCSHRHAPPTSIAGAAAATRPCRSAPSPIARAPGTRTFFSLPDISKLASNLTGSSEAENEDGRGVETDGEVQKFHARKILPYSQAQLYALVSDVPSYSSFIPFCTSSRVLHGLGQDDAKRGTKEWKPDDQPFDVDAELTVGFGGLEERYTSRVAGRPFESVTATAAKQSPLFKSLKTTWSFSPASPLSPHASASTVPASSTTSRPPNSTEPTSPDEGPTLLTIDLAFSFANPLHRIASQAVLPKVADKMVEAFEQRCVEVWGKGTD